MRVLILTDAQAAGANLRFGGWFQIHPIPVRNSKQIVTVDTLLALKAVIIDTMRGKPVWVEKAKELRDRIKNLPILELDEHLDQLFDYEDENDMIEYKSRFISDVTEYQ